MWVRNGLSDTTRNNCRDDRRCQRRVDAVTRAGKCGKQDKDSKGPKAVPKNIEVIPLKIHVTPATAEALSSSQSPSIEPVRATPLFLRESFKFSLYFLGLPMWEK